MFKGGKKIWGRLIQGGVSGDNGYRTGTLMLAGGIGREITGIRRDRSGI